MLTTPSVPDVPDRLGHRIGESVYPVALRVDGRRCLVVGGGPVATRKAAGLKECGALVTVIAPAAEPGLRRLVAREAEVPPSGDRRGTVTLVRRRYEPGDVEGFCLVITATGTPAVDGLVAHDADRSGIWVNSADDPDHCSFFLPSVHRDDPVTIAVSTAGNSPALAAWLRHRIAQELGPGIGRMASLLGAGRERLRSAGRTTGDVDWTSLIESGLLKRTQAGDLREDAGRVVAQAVERALGVVHDDPGNALRAGTPSTRSPPPGSPPARLT